MQKGQVTHRIVTLHHGDVAFGKKALAGFKQAERFFQKCLDQLAGGGLARVDHNDKIPDFFALPAFQRLNQGQVAVGAQAVRVVAQVKLVGVQAGLFAHHGKAAQKVLVQAAAVGCFDLCLHRFGPGSLPGLLACLLHADAGFAPKLFPVAALHLSLLAGGVLGPKAVAVAHKFPVQLLQFVRLLSGKPAVNGPGGGHGPVFAQCLVGFLPQPAHRTGQGWHLQGINRLLHGNIAGQPPQAGVPASAQPGVAEHAVQNAVQHRAGQIAPVAAVQPNEPFRVIAQSRAVRGKVVQPRGRGGHQRTQGRVHVAQVQVQLTADAVHGAFGHGGNPFFLGQNMLGGH